MRRGRGVLVAGLFLLLAGPVLAAGGPAFLAAPPQALQAPQANGVADVSPPPEIEKGARPAPSEWLGGGLGAAAGPLPAVRLGPLDVATLLAEDEARARASRHKVGRIGVGRDLRMGPEDGLWQPLPGGGGLWTGEVESAGAAGLRLHLTRLALPPGSEIAVYPAPAPKTPPAALAPAPSTAEKTPAPSPSAPAPSAAPTPPPRPGRVEIHEAHAGSAAELWTGTVAGERARLEIYVPAGGRPRFLVDGLQHLYRDPLGPDPAAGAGTCHNDVTCYPQWAAVARAVGKLTFIEGQQTSACTGELLATQAADQTPYFLTAHHCISTPAVAATAEVFWRYQTATCGGPPPSIDSVPASLGATLLATGAPSDFTLLMIAGALPRRLFWAGWTAAPVADGTRSASIHHPLGDFKRISFGDKGSLVTCGGPSHVRVDWTSGPTEDFSSGAGIYRDDTQQLYGQLDCGPSACGSVTHDDYGAFAATYPAIAALLAAGSDDDSEPNGSCQSARRLTRGTLPGRIVKSTAPDWYRVRVPPGRTATVTLSFANANGDIDARLVGGCGGPVLAVANGQTDTEVLSFSNPGPAAAFVEVEVYLYLGTRNLYDIGLALR
jgi:hypothetical protein